MKVRVSGPLNWGIGRIREADVHIAGCTAREVLNRLVAAYPRLKEKVFRDGQTLQRGLNVFVSNGSIRFPGGLRTMMEEGDELILVPLLGAV
jgi:molybdopterin converting factor small subunit